MRSARRSRSLGKRREERGQMLVFVAAVIPIILGMTAFAIDLGGLMVERRDLQNAADSIALAAAQELPDQGEATTKAQAWATKNGIPVADMTLQFTAQSPSVPNPKVKVTVEQNHSFVFAPVIGLDNADVQASAAGIKTSAAGGVGVVPLSVTEDALATAGWGDPVVLKYDANDITTGNTGPLRIDGPGSGNCTTSDNYCLGVREGAEHAVCAQGADTTYCDGPYVVNTEPGNKVGATREAIEARVDNTATECDEFEDVFQDDPTSSDPAVYAFNPLCNPFTGGGYASDRVLIIPVIEELCNGTCAVTIVDFALFFLEDFAGGDCTGNDCEVVGRFVRVDQNVGLLAGTFDSTSSNQFVRLVE